VYQSFEKVCMNNLLDFVRKYSYFFLFLLLEIISLTLLVRFNSYQGSVWFSAANSWVAWTNKIYTQATSYIQLRQVNRSLSQQNAALQMQNEALRRALGRAEYTPSQTELLVHQQLKGYHLLPATVISNSIERANNYLVIDRGEADGVKPEMGVVGSGGVIGIVYLTNTHRSLVIPVTNRKSSISCRVRGENYFGYLQWDGGPLTAYVDDVPRYAKVRTGQAIETSGYSAIFPPGIFVGRIEKIRNSADGQSYRLDIRLGNNFANLRDVQVVTTPYKAEIDTLRAHAAELDDGQ